MSAKVPVEVLPQETPILCGEPSLVSPHLLVVMRGRQWILLPGQIMEGTGNLYICPFWGILMGSVALWADGLRSWGWLAPRAPQAPTWQPA